MKILGFSIAKNCVSQAYPIDLVMLQHQSLFDTHIIGVDKNDSDGTVDLIKKISKTTTNEIIIHLLDWSGDAVWTEESLDKKLQQQIINWAMEKMPGFDWVVKIDADEFYHEKDFQQLTETMEYSLDIDSIKVIATRYRQYMGNLLHGVYDPTESVRHIFKPGQAFFSGNDAMQIDPKDRSEILLLQDVLLHHVGYIKDPVLITRKIREHFVLNESMYEISDISQITGYDFQFPAHKDGAKLWPIGIASILHGAPNETEYYDIDLDDVPYELRKRHEKFNFMKANQ